MSIWKRFRYTNHKHKWHLEWKNKSIIFNEGGFFFAFDLFLQPKFNFHIFLYPGFPLIISFRQKEGLFFIGGWQKREKQAKLNALK
jgi:hypothetical protein